ncbi:MAG: glycosyl-4,4-diaponeurosporenoate acyltransferase [Spartobacteria bacterium]|nr:glycosyl-4,4-diaponeurosporenoate acyltransferase [Spartobacteria bacterium]
MLIELPMVWTTVFNVLAWLIIQLGLAWSFTQFSAQPFDYLNAIARPRDWERAGRFYERVFAIKRWKDKLPDASRMFRGGFAKANLQRATPEYIDRFLREPWRGELVHWLALLTLPLFAIWNPWWGVWVNAAVALSVNFPCILALRYNRARFLKLLARERRPSHC